MRSATVRRVRRALCGPPGHQQAGPELPARPAAAPSQSAGYRRRPSRQTQALDTFWITYEIAGVSLVEMRAWRWLYAHPEADAAGFQAEVPRLAKEVWNEYFAPVFRVRDCPVLAVYQHMVYHPLYLADYALGHLIHFQVESALAGKPLGAEMERMCRQGSLTPRYWMRGAVGRDLSAEPLLEAARAAARTAE